jgi:ribosome maturation factor RimP
MAGPACAAVRCNLTMSNPINPVIRGVAFAGRLFLFLDIERPKHEGLEGRIADLVAPAIEPMGYELVRVLISGKERPVVQIMADRADGAPFRVEDCEAISHLLSAVIDVADPIRGQWTLEVSSPGIDRPLTRTKDFLRFAGHVATIELDIPIEGRRRFRGAILGADAETVRVRLEDGGDLLLPRSGIRRAKLVLTDELIAATAATEPAATAATEPAATAATREGN